MSQIKVSPPPAGRRDANPTTTAEALIIRFVKNLTRIEMLIGVDYNTIANFEPNE